MMKSCKPYQEIINNMEYTDLPANERDQLMAHINDCSDCNVKFEDLKNLLSQLDEKIRPEPLPGFEDRLWHNVSTAVKPKEESSLISKIQNKFTEYY